MVASVVEKGSEQRRATPRSGRANPGGRAIVAGPGVFSWRLELWKRPGVRPRVVAVRADHGAGAARLAGPPGPAGRHAQSRADAKRSAHRTLGAGGRTGAR